MRFFLNNILMIFLINDYMSHVQGHTPHLVCIAQYNHFSYYCMYTYVHTKVLFSVHSYKSVLGKSIEKTYKKYKQ